MFFCTSPTKSLHVLSFAARPVRVAVVPLRPPVQVAPHHVSDSLFRGRARARTSRRSSRAACSHPLDTLAAPWEPAPPPTVSAGAGGRVGGDAGGGGGSFWATFDASPHVDAPQLPAPSSSNATPGAPSAIPAGGGGGGGFAGTFWQDFDPPAAQRQSQASSGAATSAAPQPMNGAAVSLIDF